MDAGQSSRKRDGTREGMGFTKIKISVPPTDLDNRPQDVDHEQSWNYTPHSRGHDEQNVRSPWHLPPNHEVPRDLRDRSRNLGRTQSESDRRSVTSMSRHNREDNGYSSDRKRSRHEDDEKNLPHKEFLNIANHNLKPLKEIPEFEVDLSLRDENVDSYQHQNSLEESHKNEPTVLILVYKDKPHVKMGKTVTSNIKKKLQDKLIESFQSGTGNGIQFEDSMFDKKNLRFTCANQMTCNWLKNTILTLDNGQLKFVHEKDLKALPIVTTFIPSKDELERVTCKKALAAQNPQLCINKWDLMKLNVTTDGYDATFSVPEEYIEKIEATKGKAYFMFSTITLNIEKRNK